MLLPHLSHHSLPAAGAEAPQPVGRPSLLAPRAEFHDLQGLPEVQDLLPQEERKKSSETEPSMPPHPLWWLL